MPMPHIEVTRYTPSAAGWAGYVSPTDGSWTLFIPADGGVPSLWVRQGPPRETDGKTERDLVNVLDLPRDGQAHENLART